MRRFVPLMVAPASVFVLAAWPIHAQDVIKIVAGARLTGSPGKQGHEVVNAVMLAVDEWNAQGGVLGKKIALVEADDQGCRCDLYLHLGA